MNDQQRIIKLEKEVKQLTDIVIRIAKCVDTLQRQTLTTEPGRVYCECGSKRASTNLV